MEDGGTSLIDFVIKVHQFIKNGQIEIIEWHKLVKIIFKQMIEFIDYIHNKNICHFDISLENFLINDIDVSVTPTRINNNETVEILKFCKENVEIKACDFGLAQYFRDGDFRTNKYCGKTGYQSPEIRAKKKIFDARSNDIFCLGVCLFRMIIGGCCGCNQQIINSDLNELLKKWNKLNYINDNKDLLSLFKSIFQFEDNRCSLSDIKKCKWLIS